MSNLNFYEMNKKMDKLSLIRGKRQATGIFTLISTTDPNVRIKYAGSPGSQIANTVADGKYYVEFKENSTN